ncbi:uncharacterized protein LOC123561838 isoform X2 [Mercenaria mercenaria]|uniref:uncharacterized protein LOC123561838 isoform X2 n=1 Tax=Mercenaria mercenaria TaxID=6596 RepID=UPI00234F1871|nr:uncharacterized protein LOC123561838 isoform X2 [Mercenaria mercenaria]
MDLNMFLVKFGIIVMFYIQPVFLAKDSMEFSKYTFAWEDAESRCLRQSQILVPGRRYRAKMIKRLMTKENVDAVWLNGWRAVSDTTPVSDGKLRTLKVDFSRPQNKELKVVCQLDSIFYDPLYTAASTDSARGICERDGAALADVTTEDGVKRITEKIVVDKPHWINSMSSGGSKIKQCLVAQRVGDDLKYSYDDCSKEYNFICVKGDDIISSFSPLISLKMARYEEFEEEIEKYEQSTMTSSEIFELFPSKDIPFEVSSAYVSLVATSYVQPKMASVEVTSSEKPVTSTDTPLEVSPTDVSSIVTSVVQPKHSSVEVSSPEEHVVDTSTETSTKETPEMIDTISATSVLVIPAITQTSYSESDTSLLSSAVVDTTISSNVLAYIDTLHSSEMSSEQAKTTRDAVDAFTVTKDIPMTNTITSDKITEQSSQSTTPVTGSSSIGGYYPESAFVDKMESETTVITQKDILKLLPSSTVPLQETLSTKMPKYIQPSDYIDSTRYAVDTEETYNTLSTESLLLQPTQSVPSQSSSIRYMDLSVCSDRSCLNESTELDELESEPSTTTPFVTGAVLVSASESQPPDVIMEPTSTQQLVSSDVSAYEWDTRTSKSRDISEELGLLYTPSVATSSSESTQTSSISEDVTSEFAPSSVISTQDVIFTENSILPDLHESSKLPFSSIVLTTSESSIMSYDCTVIDSTSTCIDTLSSTYTTDELSEYKTQSETYAVTETPIFSSLSSSPLSSSISSLPSPPLPKSSFLYVTYDMDKDTESLMPDMPSSATATVVQTSSMYDYGYDYGYDQTGDEYDHDDATDEGRTFSPSSTTRTVVETPSIYEYDYYDRYDYTTTPDQIGDEDDHDATPRYTIDTYDPVIDTLNETNNVDEEIPGDIDKGDMDDDDNEVGNASADTGEIVEKKNGDEEEGIEAGLWVAFAILITLVLIALILAAYLYRKRKLQKSKDISAAPPAAAGETVELRDSRSPSRENGKPRESATFKDPAYDI